MLFKLEESGSGYSVPVLSGSGSDNMILVDSDNAGAMLHISTDTLIFTTNDAAAQTMSINFSNLDSAFRSSFTFDTTSGLAVANTYSYESLFYCNGAELVMAVGRGIAGVDYE